jgi:hypothetical protein
MSVCSMAGTSSSSSSSSSASAPRFHRDPYRLEEDNSYSKSAVEAGGVVECYGANRVRLVDADDQVLKRYERSFTTSDGNRNHAVLSWDELDDDLCKLGAKSGSDVMVCRAARDHVPYFDKFKSTKLAKSGCCLVGDPKEWE